MNNNWIQYSLIQLYTLISCLVSPCVSDYNLYDLFYAYIMYDTYDICSTYSILF